MGGFRLSKRQIFNALVAALYITGASLATASAQTVDKVKIGFITSLTGPVSIVGAEQKRGMEIALKHLGGKIGGVPLEIVEGDDQTRPDAGVQLVNRMLTRDGVQIFTGLAATNVFMAVMKPIVDAGGFLIGAGAGPAAVAGALCNPNTFVVSWPNDGIAEAVGKYLTDMGTKRLYLIASNYQAGLDNLEGVKRFYKGEVIGQSLPALDVVDYSGEFAQIRAAKPEAVFAFIANLVPFMRQHDQSGLKRSSTLYGGMWLADGASLKAQGDAAIGFVGATHWYPGMANAENIRFVMDFVAKFGREPNMFAQQQYDAMMLINSAVNAVGGRVSDTEALRAAFKKAEFKSLRGKFRFNRNNFPIQDYYMVRVEKAGDSLVHKEVATVFQDRQDSHIQACKMQ